MVFRLILTFRLIPELAEKFHNQSDYFFHSLYLHPPTHHCNLVNGYGRRFRCRPSKFYKIGIDAIHIDESLIPEFGIVALLSLPLKRSEFD